MSLPVKPAMCIADGRLCIFMGADYKAMDLATADKFVRRLQGELAKLKRAHTRQARDARKAAP